MLISADKPVIFLIISFLNPNTILMVSSITDSPSIIPKIPIFTIGLEILLWCPSEFVMRFAMYFSTFNVMSIKNKSNKLITLAIVYFTVFISLGQNLVIEHHSLVTTGAQQFAAYVPLLKNKKVAIVTNQTGVVNGVSIVDTLLKLNVNIKKIFGPEHGFRGDTEAGEHVTSNVDKKTGITIVSLYGSNKKPSSKDLAGIDVVIYDIQDLGVRFYTYISTMCYVMEACAENKKEMIVLDRPNPNGFYVDGPVLKPEFKGFLGLHPVPIVYGMTCGEYAQMANGEGWLKTTISKKTTTIKCKLKIIPCLNYNRKASYTLPINPSPNIPNHQAVLLYPCLGLFEGTIISLGRGTTMPFQVIGHPKYNDTTFSFKPLSTKLSSNPKYVNQKCFGIDLRNNSYVTNHPKKIELAWLFLLYSSLNDSAFFDKNFNYHSGNSELQGQVKGKFGEIEVRSIWQNDLNKFKSIRKKYLIYLDFE